jgi:hypothetical protein
MPVNHIDGALRSRTPQLQLVGSEKVSLMTAAVAGAGHALAGFPRSSSEFTASSSTWRRTVKLRYTLNAARRFVDMFTHGWTPS